MLPNDLFQRSFDKTIGDLRGWLSARTTFARVDEEAAPTFWRCALSPTIAGACPVELILHRDQRFDITIGAETYEGRKIENIGVFLPLLDAIAEGRVVTRQAFSTRTGAPAGVETQVTLSHGALWTERRGAAAANGSAIETRDRYYVPYERELG